ncbi:uncharacterized protein MKK02DRAFT_28824 [Dioszegia hungarica]|uniref:Proteasome assembly chaperone 3 n=1 Tax=Dioszegia hungarica TaxID=4972 RepID=A0AA38LSK0_9TREE|nr:uncharacterized protein MKK02DRAFT_28824 [Dioszegia hungarica]KAI9634140.1 hypothetical protein MKK02DRAFT_28824 [Dioszegia hungarica]
MSSLLEEYHPASALHQTAAVNGDAPQPSPIPSFQLRRSMPSGGEVELLIQTFDDRILVIITQNGKVGCLTQAALPAVVPLPQPPRSAPTSSLSHFPPPPPSITLTSLLGSPPNRALHETYVAHIATLIWWTLQEVKEARRPVVVGLSLERKRRGVEGQSGVEDDGEEGSLELDEVERERFEGVLGMVAEWAGPKG